MKKLIIEPQGWPCALRDCPPGPFVCEDRLCFKSEYHNERGRVQAYNSVGEFFCVEDDSFVVQPVKALWVEEEE